MTKEKEQNQKTFFDKLCTIFAWFWGVIFLIIGVSQLFSLKAVSFLTGIVGIATAIMLVPTSYKWLNYKFNFELKRSTKVIVAIVSMIIISTLSPASSSDTTNATQTIPTDDIQINTTQQQIDEVKKPLCSLPYIEYKEGECCLDENNNSICDNDEQNEEGIKTTDSKYLEKTYDDLWSIFNPDSRYTDLAKENTFNTEYKGEYVKWSGQVVEVDASILDNLRLYVDHNGVDGYDVLVYINQDQYSELVKLKKGDVVTYTAKFRTVEYSQFFDSVVFTMDDGEIVKD